MRYRRLGDPGHEIPVACTDQGLFDLRPLTDGRRWRLPRPGEPRGRAHAIERGSLPIVEGGEGLRVGAPIARPGKVVCIGLNYRDHAAETGARDARPSRSSS